MFTPQCFLRLRQQKLGNLSCFWDSNARTPPTITFNRICINKLFQKMTKILKKITVPLAPWTRWNNKVICKHARPLWGVTPKLSLVLLLASPFVSNLLYSFSLDEYRFFCNTTNLRYIVNGKYQDVMEKVKLEI